ncbi:Thg1-domain-containing protein [Sporormia fimetaria CBS 119925]|uniref:tRNA(His) guanylyltransferase n=1 Tax=Sporormia fimetaria CBS 119925 TaxID=1340428 RepID=A0A6A6VPR1_9PLEO|nr:Thg1-domain-containing protein [Sporormia fimetaria CBS 119925]
MANSKYEYVRSFEQPDILLANTWIVVRIDGRGFTKFTTRYHFVKPNDRRALDLMNAAAEAVMKELPDLCLAYGNSDEYSFVFHKNCSLFERRASKLTTTIVSTFSAYYTFLWSKYFPDDPLMPPLPSFDGRAVCYPSDRNLRDYMSWRQVDCHINNLYNTTFWTLVQKGGMDARAAEQELSGTVSSDKNEILFSRFGINYNNEPEIFKKGSVMYRDFFPTTGEPSTSAQKHVDTSTALAHPRPRRATARPVSQPIERSPIEYVRDSPLSFDPSARGPTFLSTASTPSPPPSPPAMSIPSFPIPQTFYPVQGPSNGSTSTMGSKLPVLTPIPLPPPTLKPSSKPPPSLAPPNPTTHTNTSPRSSSSPMPPKQPAHPNPPRPTLKQRSPSLSILDSHPPIIPLRISSIPTNNKPRKLSLQGSGKSLGVSAVKPDEKEAPTPMPVAPTKREKSPPSLMKELPSPPTEEDGVKSGDKESPPVVPQKSSNRPATATSATAVKSRTERPKDKKSKPRKAKVHNAPTEDGGWAAGTLDDGRPQEMSKTQREKDRKKRTKARIVVEHVDVIRDEFWEKRPWILSGKTGV